MNNPINLIKSMMSKLSPQQIVMNMVGNSSPVMKNLIEMANKGDKDGIEKFARNLYRENGKDFDKEFNQFISNFK